MADYAESIAGCLYVSSVSADAGVHPADTNRVRAIIVYDRIWIVYDRRRVWSGSWDRRAVTALAMRCVRLAVLARCGHAVCQRFRGWVIIFVLGGWLGNCMSGSAGKRPGSVGSLFS